MLCMKVQVSAGGVVEDPAIVTSCVSNAIFFQMRMVERVAFVVSVVVDNG